MDSIKTVLQKKLFTDDTPNYISREFQDYGYRLGVDLNDPKHTSLYIKLAKEEPRNRLEKARQFAIDYPHATNKGKIFMWALQKLRQGKPVHLGENNKSSIDEHMRRD